MDTKNENKEKLDLETITAYVQLVIYTMKKSKIDFDSKSIKAEVKMYFEKFGNDEVKRISKLIIREKK